MSSVCTLYPCYCLHQLTLYFQIKLPIVRITLFRQYPMLRHRCDKPLFNSHPSFNAFAKSIHSTFHCSTNSVANMELTYRSKRLPTLLGDQPVRLRPRRRLRKRRSSAPSVPSVAKQTILLVCADPIVSPTYLPYTSKINLS